VPQVPSDPEGAAAEAEGDEWGDFAEAAEEGDPTTGAPTAPVDSGLRPAKRLRWGRQWHIAVSVFLQLKNEGAESIAPFLRFRLIFFHSQL